MRRGPTHQLHLDTRYFFFSFPVGQRHSFLAALLGKFVFFNKTKSFFLLIVPRNWWVALTNSRTHRPTTQPTCNLATYISLVCFVGVH